MTKDYICVEMLLTSVYHWICAKVIMIFLKLFSNGLTQVGFLFDTDCMAVHTCHTVEHILLQYYITKVFCFSLLLYSISYIVDLAIFFSLLLLLYKFVHIRSNLTNLVTY